MFSERMEALIKATLADGVLTDQEKKALVSRAEKEGVDLNELEIYIQSILQERQQELEKKSREARAQQEEADLESEKLRSKTLRECPKCGTRIPHLANACPNCGYIIEKSELDEKLSFLKSLLERCIDNLEYDSHNGGAFDLGGNSFFEIPQDQYKRYTKLIVIRDCGANDGAQRHNAYFVEINYQAVKTESELYKNNEVIKESLERLRNREKDVLLDKCEELLQKAKSTLTVGSKKYGYINGSEGFNSYFGEAKKIIRRLKSDYFDLSSDEIKELDEEIKTLSKQSEEIQQSPKFQKAMKKAERNGCSCLVILLLIPLSALCFAFL